MKNLYIITAYSLIALYYIKFLFQIILKNEDLIILDIALYVLLLFMFVTNKNNNRIWLLFVFAIISLFTPTARNVFLVFLTTYLLGQLPLNNIVKANLIFQLFVFLYMLSLLVLGVIQSQPYLEVINDDRNRWDFGYGNPNRFSLFIYSILINLYIILNKNNTVIFSFLVIICAIPVFWITQSRSFVYSLTILIITHFVIINKSKFWIKHKSCFLFIPHILFFLVFYFAYLVEEFPILDLLFMHRLSEYSRLIVNSSVINYIIGNPMIVDESITIDSSYVHMVFEAGILTVIIFLTMYHKTIKHIDRQNLYFIPLSLSVLAYGITESLLLFILNFGCMIYWSVLYSGYRKSLRTIPRSQNEK